MKRFTSLPGSKVRMDFVAYRSDCCRNRSSYVVVCCCNVCDQSCAVVCRAVKSSWTSVFSSLMINCACGLSAGSMSIFVWRIAAFCCFISSKISDRERPEYSILVLLHA